MRQKPYYSVRTGKNPLAKSFNLEALRKLFETLFTQFEDGGYFQEAFGYDCVDSGYNSGTLGQDLAGALMLQLRKDTLTPIRQKIANYAEDDLFDIIEFLYEHCSLPLKEDGWFHDYSGCGWHYRKFERDLGRQEFRGRINELLAPYESGYELSTEGEILTLAANGLETLFDAPLLEIDPQNVDARVAAAQTKFRRYRASPDDRRDAIRSLVDVLEYLRPQVKRVLTRKDEADLFDIANNFGIRHHNDKQKTSYDEHIWYEWMFYYYLATIHAAVQLLKRNEQVSEEIA